MSNAVLVGMGLWMALGGSWNLALVVSGLFVLVLVGCEVVPKTLAVRDPERWALRVAAPLAALHGVSRPVRVAAQRMCDAILRRFIPSATRPQAPLTDAEYEELIEMAAQQGALAREEKEIILQIIQLDRRTARDIMRPRSTMACVSDELEPAEMMREARRHGHRRLPVYDETPDTIVGVLNAQALLLHPEADLSEVLEIPSFVPGGMNLLKLFRSLQRQKRGLAMVSDEYGGVAGVVRMEDILEEIVGPLRAPVVGAGFVMERLGQGRWRVSGGMRIDDFDREFPALGEVDGVQTLGGLVVRLMEVVPKAGEAIEFRGLRFTVLSVDPRRVRELLVERLGG